jgi:hypothetical protein
MLAAVCNHQCNGKGDRGFRTINKSAFIPLVYIFSDKLSKVTSYFCGISLALGIIIYRSRQWVVLAHFRQQTSTQPTQLRLKWFMFQVLQTSMHMQFHVQSLICMNIDISMSIADAQRFLLQTRIGYQYIANALLTLKRIRTIRAHPDRKQRRYLLYLSLLRCTPSPNATDLVVVVVVVVAHHIYWTIAKANFAELQCQRR